MAKKILVLTDPSAQAMEVVRYVGSFLPPKNVRVVLFHVFDPVPECYWDLENNPHVKTEITRLKSWEVHKRESIQTFMDQATALLVSCGFDRSLIDIRIQERDQGIARDIMTEAQAGYDAVFFRRRGITALESLVVGSVANKLLSTLTSVPLIVCGDLPPEKKILAAVDDSETAFAVVDVITRFYGNTGYCIELFNVIRGLAPWMPELPDAMIRDRFGLAREEMALLFTDLKKRLTDAGIDPSGISEKIVTGDLSRAGAIIREATEQNFPTIIMGRRRISKVEAFFLGRVSNKVIHGAKNHTVWVI